VTGVDDGQSGDRLHERCAVVPPEERALDTAVGHLGRLLGEVLPAQHVAGAHAAHLRQHVAERIVGLVDEHAHREHQVEPAVAEWEFARRLDEHVRIGHELVDERERLAVDVDAVGMCRLDGGRDEPQVAAHIAADLENAARSGALDDGRPERGPQIVGAEVAIDVLVSEFAAPEVLESLGFGGLAVVGHHQFLTVFDRARADRVSS
jgi:hypothetical protein